MVVASGQPDPGFDGFNVVLIQWYDEKGAIGWHADDEDCLVRGPDGKVLPIVSISLGASAVFKIRPKETPEGQKRRESSHLLLEGEDVLVMWPGAQEEFEHSIRKGDIKGERICLTFRCQTDCKAET